VKVPPQVRRTADGAFLSMQREIACPQQQKRSSCHQILTMILRARVHA
jgi:hypothetical protein